MGLSPNKRVACNYFIIEMYAIFISVLCVAFCKLEVESQVNKKISVSIPALRTVYIYIYIYIYEYVCHCISGSLSPRHGASSGCGWRNGLR